jgi:capsular polysaccharide transport system permease protein
VIDNNSVDTPANKKQIDISPIKAKKAELSEVKTQKAATQDKPLSVASVAPPASSSRPHKRHWGVLVSFIVIFILPLFAIWWYLSERAADQYVSKVGFSVRTEETASAMDIFGSLTALSKGSSSDTDILYEFIQSQELVQKLNEELDLRALYSIPQNDPFFSFDNEGSIEDLVDYWARMVKIYYDGSTGLIELNVLAFDPDDALRIAEAIFRQSSTKINELSAIARNDATRYAKEDLDLAIERLKASRRAITDFRNKHQIVDPQADIQGQVGLLNTLQVQLADALIELDLLKATTRVSDPRVEQVTLKISVIRARIKAERNKFGQNETSDGEAFSKIVGDYEELAVDREFAEQAYLSSLSAFNSAKAEAQRQSRYLAAYISPTKAGRSTHPKKTNIMILSALFLFLTWAILVLLAYAIKDRR